MPGLMSISARVQELFRKSRKGHDKPLRRSRVNGLVMIYRNNEAFYTYKNDLNLKTTHPINQKQIIFSTDQSPIILRATLTAIKFVNDNELFLKRPRKASDFSCKSLKGKDPPSKNVIYTLMEFQKNMW